MTKTIGFFGDSFCAERINHHSIFYRYDTYIELLAKHYDSKIVNLGHGGCGVWDTLLIQLNPFIESNTVPDICVFVWTIPARLYNRKVRRLNSTDVDHKIHFTNRDIWTAGKYFYKYLCDYEKEHIEHIAALRYIDQVILPQFPATTKIVHLWTAGTTKEWSTQGIRPSNTTYPHTWTHGVEVRPSLLSVSLFDNDISILKSDHRTNHLDGKFKNQLVFDWIKRAIEGNETLYDYSTAIDTLYDKSQATDLPAT